ncbi:hypothetical protein HMPREF0072_1134 [Anaerococcus lactolyticus ATCC 51172]|uniref:DUF1538 domain-containing protein n=1 Tax=Anaerococcus lactolyticus ATCC 51172 TaxID=525254 RepID=C2BFL4_9FIRM|nr:DUF1538 domain-containing protein [Anaerococcus lactolyticus]EEI86301.1 hypothetical protein HMPREF0072_1134 [Anaerococcus lactolyticus ATCC 51172]
MIIIFLDEIKNTSKSVIPIAILVVILNFFVGVENGLLVNFFLGCVGVIVGLGVFLTGVEISVSEIGSMMGEFLGRFDKLIKVIVFGVFIGFTISIAEPDLLILAGEVTSAIGIPAQVIVMIISLGVGIMISAGLFRIFKDISLSTMMCVIYGLVFILMIFTEEMGHAIAFDASGATTGAMTTPFIIALGLGVANLKGEKSEDDSFGLVGLASTGPILAGLLMSLFKGGGGEIVAEEVAHTPLMSGFINSTFAIVPIALVFYIMNHLYFKTEKDELKSITLGLIYTYIGLIIFLTSVEGGFMELARVMGEGLADSKFLPLIGFVLGLLVVLAEPAVAVLSEQVEDVTGGSIPRKNILTALSIGVAFAVMLAIFRIRIEGFALWMLIVPGFLISLILSRRVDQIFVGIAFDSGGVASGPMTATFILAFCQGVAGNIADGFGVISFVAMMPVLTIMIMGNLYKGAR